MNMDYKCIIIDDDTLAIKVLKKHIEHVPQLEIIGNCASAFEALNLLSKERVDLIFLDIQMPNLIGTQFLRTLTLPPKVIFTTAHKDFAIEAFELNAVDYLLKPIYFERFLKAVNKALLTNESLPQPSNIKEQFVYFRADRKMIKVLITEILYIESNRDYGIIYMENARKLKVKLTLNHIEKLLPCDQFLRIHRSFLVSINKITAFTKTDVEIGKIELPLGTSYTCFFHKIMSNNSNLPGGVPER